MAYDIEAIQGPERDRYVEAIQHDLDSIVPRITYAEWLRGKGFEDRAQCILLQSSLYTLTTEEHGNVELRAQEHNRLEAVAELEKDLWKAHGKDWQAVENPPSDVLSNVEWERGFPYFGTIDWRTVDRAKLREVMSHYPIQGLVVLNITWNDMRAFLQEPWILQVRHLILEGNQLGDDGARVIAEGENLEKLQYLNLAQCGVGMEGAKAIASAKDLKGLHVLRVRGNDIGLEGVYALAQASQNNLPNLWKITVRKQVDRHDPGEFYGEIDVEMMAQYGFTKKIDGGQTWQKQALQSSEEGEVKELSPQDILGGTAYAIYSTLT